MLAQPIVEVFSNSALLACANFQDRPLEALAFCYVDSCNDHMRGCAVLARENPARPGDQSGIPASRQPVRLVIPWQLRRIRMLKNCLEAFYLFRHQEQIPYILSTRFCEGISRCLFAGAVETNYPPLRIENHDQSSHDIENRGQHVALFLQRFFRLLQLRDVYAHAMNKPGAAVLLADHLGFAMEPKNSSVAREHSIGGLQRFAGEKHFRRFGTPTLLIVRINLLVPAHRIFQPLVLRKTERSFNLGADVGFANSFV